MGEKGTKEMEKGMGKGIKKGKEEMMGRKGERRLNGRRGEGKRKGK